MNRIRQTHEIGQSIWLDYIRRDLLDSGELSRRVGEGTLRGVTSNPTIFENAIAGSDLYNAALRPLAQAGWQPEKMFYALAIDDIRRAADAFLPLFEQSNGRHGFVSIEVSPKLAFDTQGTLNEARRLWALVNRPNVMIKIPATKEGVPAIEQAITDAINVNVTLIFSLNRYQDVMEAYLRGLETRLERGEALSPVSSVASFFVSRVDTAVDARLDRFIGAGDENEERAKALRGKIAIANAKLAYAQFKAMFADPRYLRLAAKGARVQRPLWASTSTKDPAYPDTYYVDNLIGPDTVNTLPPDTLEAFADHGSVDVTLEQGLSDARAQITAVEALGIKMEEVTAELEHQGVEKFAVSYDQLLSAIQKEARRMSKELGPLTEAVRTICDRLDDEGVLSRLWQGETSLWTTDPKESEEVARRLGWLTLPEDMKAKVADIDKLADEILQDGIKQVVLLGMGGSSLASDVFRRIFQDRLACDFIVLDSTDPVYIRSVARKAPIRSSLFIASSKSGTTTETRTLLEYFWQKAENSVGNEAGGHFIAVTDPGTPLHDLAVKRDFRRVFTATPEVGGRYSALSHFGLVPASLMGLDISALLDGGQIMARYCRPDREVARNPGAFLGAVMGAAANAGRNKLTLVADPDIEPICDWIEQLIAESTGKQGKGLLPIVGEPAGSGKVYPPDRLLIYLRSGGRLDRRMSGWVNAGVPFVVLDVHPQAGQIGAAFFQWEMATAVAGHVLGINAFNQPNVQRAKESAHQMLNAYQTNGNLPYPPEIWSGRKVKIYGSNRKSLEGKKGLRQAAQSILSQLKQRNVLVILGYLNPNQGLSSRLVKLQRSIRDQSGLVATFGFGPRYLHSTGQYHKGGTNEGLFLILAREVDEEEQIPGQNASFAVLEMAQALGDLEALKEEGRSAYLIVFHSAKEISAFLDQLTSAIKPSRS